MRASLNAQYMSAPKIIRRMTSILRGLVRPQNGRVAENAAQSEIEAMPIDRVLARDLFGDLAGGQQLDQILIKRMHPLPHTSFNNAIQKLKFIFCDCFLRAAIDAENFDARQAVAVDRRNQS